jgi:peptidoglycan/xylan/chitin deacetylase (PgdA/CDA1 family)
MARRPFRYLWPTGISRPGASVLEGPGGFLANWRIVFTLRRAALSFGLCLLALPVLAPAVAGAQTVVSLTFDDGIVRHYTEARPQLAAHGMLGTFYINSGTVSAPGTPNRFTMTWSEIDALHAERNEIGGHTVNHVNLEGASYEEAQSQICDDAATLRGRGYQVIDFAYPEGAGYDTDDVREVLGDCGFVSARTYGELRGVCTSCPPVEGLPPPDPYRVRTPYPTGSDPATPQSLNLLKGWVTRAETAGGGWVPIVFHDICGGSVACPPTPFHPTNPAAFGHFLDFLASEQAAGRVEVKTVRHVLGYPDPAPPPPPGTATPREATPAAGDKVTAFASLSARSVQDIDKLYVSAGMSEAGTLIAGGSVNVPSASKVHRFRTTSTNAVPGKVVKLRLRLSKKSLRAVKRALRRHKKLRAKLTITARDRAGNAKIEKRTVRLRP